MTLMDLGEYVRVAGVEEGDEEVNEEEELMRTEVHRFALSKGEITGTQEREIESIHHTSEPRCANEGSGQKRGPARFILADITKPITDYSSPMQLLNAVKDYIVLIDIYRSIGIDPRLIGLEMLSIGSDAGSASGELGMGIITDLDCGTQDGKVDSCTKVNTLPAKLLPPDYMTRPLDMFEAPREILLCLVWIMTTRSGLWRGAAASKQGRVAIYRWYKRGQERLDRIGSSWRYDIFEVMTDEYAFFREIIEFIHPCFAEFGTHLDFLRFALYDPVRFVKFVFVDEAEGLSETAEDEDEGESPSDAAWPTQVAFSVLLMMYRKLRHQLKTMKGRNDGDAAI